MVEYSQALANQLDAYLKSQNWNYEYDREAGLFRFGIALQNKMNSCRMAIMVGPDLFTSYAICPLRADTDSRAKVNDYLARANFGLKIGNFELDMWDGEIRYKSTLYCGKIVPSMDAIERVADMPFRMMERYGNGLLNVLFGNASPAIEIAQIDE